MMAFKCYLCGTVGPVNEDCLCPACVKKVVDFFCQESTTTPPPEVKKIWGKYPE